MYRNTRFGEILKGLSRGAFDRLVNEHESDKYCKGFRTWDQLVAMIYAQFSQCQSLREVESSFNNQAMHHYHLNCNEVKRSTLADANSKKDSSVFLATCQLLLTQASRKMRKEVKKHLCLLDSSPIVLKGHGYDEWTKENRTRRIQGVKMHMLFSPEIEIPMYLNISDANVNDINDAMNIVIESGSTYVFDKGYYDYNWWYEIEDKGAYFVTRFKRNCALEVLQHNPIPEQESTIVLADYVVRFSNKNPGGGRKNRYKKQLRQIIIDRPDHKTPLVLATNDFSRSALDIAQCYKDRWQIELFFKWLKQNLKIKKYLGRSENAVRIQIATAIISYLLLALYRHTKQLKLSMKETFVLLRTSLFQRQELGDYEKKRRRKKQQKEFLQRQGVLL